MPSSPSATWPLPMKSGRDLTDPPSPSAVRVMLARLEKKGHLKHRQDGARHLYSATTSATVAKRTALRHCVRTFFGGSLKDTVTSLVNEGSWTDDDLLALRAESIGSAATNETMTALWILLKVTVITGGGLIAVRAARRQRASLRHLFLSATFVLALLVPLTTLFGPTICVTVPSVTQTMPKVQQSGGAADAVPLAAAPASDHRTDDVRSAVMSPLAVLLGIWLIGIACFDLACSVRLGSAFYRCGDRACHGRKTPHSEMPSKRRVPEAPVGTSPCS